MPNNGVASTSAPGIRPLKLRLPLTIGALILKLAGRLPSPAPPQPANISAAGASAHVSNKTERRERKEFMESRGATANVGLY